MKESPSSLGHSINEEIKKDWFILDLRSTKSLYGAGGKTLMFTSKEVATEIASQMFFSSDNYLVLSLSKNIGI